MSSDHSGHQSAFQLPAEQVERLLRSGEEPELLKSYFGDAEYLELRELACKAARSAKRGGPKVFILPGILGSTIGIKGRMFDNTIWFDPVSIVGGELTKLAVRGERTRGEALGIIPLIYTKLKLRLWWYGFDPEYHYYDWRHSVGDLGEELAARIEDARAEEVYLVAHSMGGLVSRAALGVDASKVKRLVMLGTPNHGSFAAVQMFRGVNDTVKKVAALDMDHDVQELVDKVFNTFPSVYQLLPSPARYDRIDLYDRGRWPGEVKPRQSLLDHAVEIRERLAPPDDRFSIIAGYSQPTITDLTVDEQGEFSYVQSRRGDGTVPLALATLPEMTTYFAEETHNGLVGNGKVAQAIRDLLNTGSTKLLPTSLPTQRDLRTETVTRAELAKRKPFGGREGHAITEGERRAILETLLSPAGARATTAAAAGTTEMAGAAPAHGVSSLQGVVIGRRRQHRLDVELVHGSITDVDARACVLGVFQNVTPTGPSKQFDELLDGAISELVSRRMFNAGIGEVFILPTGTHRVCPEHVLFAGLGQFDQFTGAVQKLVAANVIRTLIRAGIDELSTVLFGGGSGYDSRTVLANLVEGLVQGLIDADTKYRFRRVALCETNANRFAEMRDHLYHLAGGPLFDQVEVTITDVAARPSAEIVTPTAARLPSLDDQPVYLTVRYDTGPDRQPGVRASILTAGGKATVLTDLQPLDPQELDSHLEQLAGKAVNLDEFGRQLAKLVLTEDFAAVLAREGIRERHLIVVHDAYMSRVPWETIKLGDDFPATRGGLSRRYMASDMAIAKWLEQRRWGGTFDVLLVVNPTGDLKGAEREGEIVRNVLKQFPLVRVTQRSGPEATRDVLLNDFQSGDYDVIHYAGHAFFDPHDLDRGGILCASRQVLSGSDLATLGNLPALVFFNACESARVRGESTAMVGQRLHENVSFAESFLRGGIANFIGTYWPVGDEPAEAFARTFYRRAVSGKAMGRALLDARNTVRKLPSRDWADYIHYGDASFRLKIRPDAEESAEDD